MAVSLVGGDGVPGENHRPVALIDIDSVAFVESIIIFTTRFEKFLLHQFTRFHRHMYICKMEFEK